MSTGRHSGGRQNRNSTNDSFLKKYRPLVPESLSDADLQHLIRKCENSDAALLEEIQALWDKETENLNNENEFHVVEKKNRKKETPASHRSDRPSRGGRSSGRVAGDRVAKIQKAPPAHAEGISKVNETSSLGKGGQRAPRSDLLSPANDAASADQSSVAGDIHEMSLSSSSIPALNSVWGGSSSLAQKIKTAEKLKVPSVSPMEDQACESIPLAAEVTDTAASKPANKPRSRKEKKGLGGGKTGDKTGAIDVVDPHLNSESASEPIVLNSQAEINNVVESSADQGPSSTIYISDEGNPTSKAFFEEKIAPIADGDGADANLVNLGKWATSNEPVYESSFQFGNFGGDSSSPVAAVGSSSGSSGNAKSSSKNTTWKAGDSSRKNSSGHNSNNSSTGRQGSSATSWVSSATEGPEFERATTDFTGSKSDRRQNSDTSAAISRSQTVPSNTAAAASPAGMSASQSAEVSKVSATTGGNQRGNSRKSHDLEQSGKQQHVQSAPPPGINQRTPAGTGFGGIMPAGMIPNIPYGSIPYDISHQAPSLHPTGTYGMMQPNFSGSSALSSTPASTPSSSTSSAATSGHQTGASTTSTSSQHQPAYQSAPPGMPAYMPYSYNPPYYGHQFYYGGQPQGYYNRGQPMYQQPPRAMYGNDAYNSNAHGLAGYPDMYGTQGAQFADSQYPGGNMHHHGAGGGGAERGGKQKNSSSSSSGTVQQSGGTSADSHPHAAYGSYSNRDGQGQYPYQGGWNSAPMMYAHGSPQVLGGPAGNFQGTGGRGQHDNSSKTSGSGGGAINGSSYSGSQYVGGGRGANSNNASSSGQSAQSGNAVPGSNLQPGGW